MELHVQLLHDSKEQLTSRRLRTIDFLRGLVMIVMALDHVREFFTNAQFSPTNLAATTGPYFVTRWITHFCAPVFSLLTGVGAFLWYSRGRTKAQLSRFLLTRGLWLIILELTLTRCLGWAFNFDYHITLAGVLWILGWSMIVLAGAIWLPAQVFAGVALIAIAGHNLLDQVSPASFGKFAWLWEMLHSPANLTIGPGYDFFTAYVLIPWFAVMMGGFSLGQVFLWDSRRRQRFLLLAGAATTGLFVVVRAINRYGDPAAWAVQKNALFTVFSFLNCTKYPPSLDFLLMTLGPPLILLGACEGLKFSHLQPVLLFGRVPLFYYIVHIPMMHLDAVAICGLQFGNAHWLFVSKTIADFPFMRPPGWGFSLPAVYLVWMLLVIALYPLCRWFAAVKQRSGQGWLSYL